MWWRVATMLTATMLVTTVACRRPPRPEYEYLPSETYTYTADDPTRQLVPPTASPAVRPDEPAPPAAVPEPADTAGAPLVVGDEPPPAWSDESVPTTGRAGSPAPASADPAVATGAPAAAPGPPSAPPDAPPAPAAAPPEATAPPADDTTPRTWYGAQPW